MGVKVGSRKWLLICKRGNFELQSNEKKMVRFSVELPNLHTILKFFSTILVLNGNF